MKFLLILTLTIATCSGHSQNNAPFHFNLGIKKGHSKVRFTPTENPSKKDEKIRHVNQIQATCFSSIKQKSGILAQQGVGLGVFSYDLQSKGNYRRMEEWNIFYKDNPFTKIGTGINYRRQLSNNNVRKYIQKEKEKRFIDPKSIFINVGSGLFFGRNIVNDPNEIFSSHSMPSWSFAANVEIGFKKQYYFEVGMELVQYWNSSSLPNYSFGSTAFVSPKINFGLSKRFINPTTNRNLINLHAGLSISYTLMDIGEYSWMETGGSATNSGNSSVLLVTFKQSNRIQNQIFPSLYIAVEKDLQLSKNLYLSFKYKYDQGFINASVTDIDYNIKPAANPDLYKYKAFEKINGTAHTYSIGVKWKFSPKK